MTTTDTPPTGSVDEALSGRRTSVPTPVQALLSYQSTPIIVTTLLLFVLTTVIAPNSLTQASLLAMLVPASVLAVAAIGQTLVVQQKGIDLAAPGFITLAAMIVTILPDRFGLPVWLSITVSLAVVGAGGYLNGIFITKLNVTPIISSLALNALLFGAMWTISGGSTVAAPAAIRSFGSAQLMSVPFIVWLAVVLVALTALYMTNTATGRRFVGVGANPASARATGIRVNSYITGAYVASGLTAGIAGILLVSYLGKSSLNLGDSYLFPIISAVIVGGAVLAGGRGSVVATAIAALFLSQIIQIVLSFGAPESVRLLVNAIAIAAAASLRLVPWKGLRKRGDKTTSA